MQALGPTKWLEPANWKTMVDNCSDNYHVPTSHLSSASVQSRFLGRPRLSHEDQFNSPNKHAFVNGHAITFRNADDNMPRYMHGVSTETMNLFEEYHRDTLAEVERYTRAADRVRLAQRAIQKQIETASGKPPSDEVANNGGDVIQINNLIAKLALPREVVGSSKSKHLAAQTSVNVA